MKLKKPLLFLLTLTTIQLNGQYHQIGNPTQWKLQYAVEAFDPETGESIGELRKGTQLEVLETDESKWTVQYQQTQGSTIIAQIEPPNLSKHFGMSFGSVSGMIQQFPLLQALLESPKQWNTRIEEIPEPVLESIDMWGVEVPEANITLSNPTNPTSKTLQLQLWDEGSAYDSSINPSQVHSLIKNNCARLERFFRLEPYRLAPPESSITATKETITRYVLPNDVAVTVRYLSREYLILELDSYRRLEQTNPRKHIDPYLIADRMKVRKWSPDGFLCLTGIPMIDQGNRNYGASATLARVLQFYGYAVDMRQMADLAKTESQYASRKTSGTRYKNVLQAARHFCSSTPYRMRQIGTNKSSQFSDIKDAIDQKTPILWFMDGHIALIIGIHPETRDIIYSDSWGTGNEYETMSWQSFETMNPETWILR